MGVSLKIVPRRHFRAYLERKQRWACMVVHRRGGKTFGCIQDLLSRAITHQRPGPPLRYGYIAPTRDQAKDIAWGYLKRYAGKLPQTKVNEADLAVTLANNASIRLYSGDSYERMRGLYFDGAVIDEFGDIDPQAWHEVVRPCLVDYAGWATFIGTPKGRNEFFETWKKAAVDPEWFSLMLKASESGIIPAQELADIRKDTPEYVYRQEYECDFSVAMPGAVYVAVIEQARSEGRICAMPVDGSNLVHTAWDLGSPENTVVWYFQIVGREIRFIDCDRGDRGTTTQRVAHMIAKGYAYGKHYLPHDAQQTERTGTTFATALAEAGLPSSALVTVSRTHSVWIGINHALEMFPALSFRSPQCDDGLTALGCYRTRPVTELTYTSEEPVHDWSSHTADAFRVMAEAHRAGMISFKHTTAEAKPDWHQKRKHRGCKPMRVS